MYNGTAIEGVSSCMLRTVCPFGESDPKGRQRQLLNASSNPVSCYGGCKEVFGPMT